MNDKQPFSHVIQGICFVTGFPVARCVCFACNESYRQEREREEKRAREQTKKD